MRGLHATKEVKMGYVLRIGYRHLEAIRSQTIGVAMSVNWAKRQFDFRDWLSEQAPELVPVFDSSESWGDIPTSFKNDRIWHFAIILNTLLMKYESDSRDSSIVKRFDHSLVSSSASDHADEDYAGSDQGGSWSFDPFAFRAGVILTIGALEEFERGTIRILTGLENRGATNGGSAPPFKPRLSDYQATNPIWNALELKKKTFTPWGRAKVLKKYSIEYPKVDWRSRLDDAWQNRNLVAHGIQPVDVTLSMFLQTHYDVFEAMNWLSAECLGRHNVLL
jgi:hypothetical protein